jgi:hypothetical protein
MAKKIKKRSPQTTTCCGLANRRHKMQRAIRDSLVSSGRDV